MKREEAKNMFRNDKDAYGKPKAIMHKIDQIYDDFEKTIRKHMKEEPLKFEDLKEGMRVEDLWGNPGTITECTDIHNVLLKFDNGGSSLYCFAEDCEDRDLTPIYGIWKLFSRNTSLVENI